MRRALLTFLLQMWETEPNWADAQLQSIRAPVLVADGDHDEAIKRAHTEYIAATIPHAGLLILPNVSISHSCRIRTSSTSPSSISSATNEMRWG